MGSSLIKADETVFLPKAIRFLLSSLNPLPPRSSSQFHQHFTSNFCANFFLPKHITNPNCKRIKVGQNTFVQKAARKILSKFFFFFPYEMQATFVSKHRQLDFEESILQNFFFLLRKARLPHHIFVCVFSFRCILK